MPQACSLDAPSAVPLFYDVKLGLGTCGVRVSLATPEL